MTTTPNPQPIRGGAVLVAVVVALIVVAAVSVSYWKRDHPAPKGSTSSSQDAPAAASPGTMDKDGRFLWLLSSEGIELSQSTDVAVNDAHRVCSRLERGESEEQVIDDIVAGSPDLTPDTAADFADIAREVFCPEV